MAWNSDGKRLATVAQNTTAVWDAEIGQELLTLSTRTLYVSGVIHVSSMMFVSSVTWSPDGKRLATGSWDKSAKVWDAGSGQELLTLSGHTSPVHSVVWSPDGKRLATGNEDNLASVWDTERGKEFLTLGGHIHPVLGVAWSPDGKQLATAGQDKATKVWDAMAHYNHGRPSLGRGIPDPPTELLVRAQMQRHQLPQERLDQEKARPRRTAS